MSHSIRIHHAAAPLAVLAAFTMTGCMMQPVRPPPQAAVEKPLPPFWVRDGAPNPTGPAASLLYYADYVRNLQPADLTHETERVRRLAAAGKSDFFDLQYCLALLAQGDESHHCQPVVDALAKPTAGHDPELRALAALLQSDLAERHRIEAAGRRAEDHTAELEKQLEELKTIERNLQQRNSEPGEKP